MQKIKTCIVLLLLISSQALAQEKQFLYQGQHILIDSNFIYSFGRKNINNSNHNKNLAGFEHNSNFCLVRYDSKGKKQWEILIDKKSDFSQCSDLIKRGNSFYTLLEIMNRNVESGIYYNELFFIRLDSLGNIIEERKIKDSTFYGFNHVFYTKQFIYITICADKVFCEKYDYNFNLIETITNPVVTSFFYDSRNDAETKENIVNIGPVGDIEVINDRAKNKTPVLYKIQEDRFIKKIDVRLDKNSKINLIPLPRDKSVSMYTQNNVIYFVIQNLQENSGKIYRYNEKLNKLQLLTDTLNDKKLSLAYLYALSDNEFILYRYGRIYDNKQSWYPDVLCYVKNGKVISRSELKKIDGEHFTTDFKVVDNKLYIYYTNTYGGDIVVKIWDYRRGIFW